MVLHVCCMERILTSFFVPLFLVIVHYYWFAWPQFDFLYYEFECICISPSLTFWSYSHERPIGIVSLQNDFFTLILQVLRHFFSYFPNLTGNMTSNLQPFSCNNEHLTTVLHALAKVLFSTSIVSSSTQVTLYGQVCFTWLEVRAYHVFKRQYS